MTQKTEKIVQQVERTLRYLNNEQRRPVAFARRISFPQVRVQPFLTVSVRQVTYTVQIGRITLTASHQRKPVIPDAFTNDPVQLPVTTWLTLDSTLAEKSTS